MKNKSKNEATPILLVTSALLAVMAVVSFNSTRKFIDNDRWVSHTYEVLGGMTTLVAHLQDAESGQRGFLLTGQSRYLAPYHIGVDSVSGDLSRLKALTRDNPYRQRELDNLTVLVRERLRILDETRTIRKNLGLNASIHAVETNKGQEAMERVRVRVSQMELEENQLLARRTTAAENAGTWTIISVSLGFLAGMGLLAAATLFVNRYIAQRRKTEIENIRLLSEAAELSNHQRNFMRDVLQSVTEGRLHLVDEGDALPPTLIPFTGEILLTPTEGLAALRRCIREAALEAHFPDARIQDLVTAASEAGMNAIVHGGGGKGWVYVADDGKVQVVVQDHGGGIDLTRLPKVTLERGFSTAGTLGHGFFLILQTIDMFWLQTGPKGTTVLLEQCPERPQPPWLTKFDIAA